MIVVVIWQFVVSVPTLVQETSAQVFCCLESRGQQFYGSESVEVFTTIGIGAGICGMT